MFCFPGHVLVPGPPDSFCLPFATRFNPRASVLPDTECALGRSDSGDGTVLEQWVSDHTLADLVSK